VHLDLPRPQTERDGLAAEEGHRRDRIAGRVERAHRAGGEVDEARAVRGGVSRQIAGCVHGQEPVGRRRWRVRAQVDGVLELAVGQLPAPDDIRALQRPADDDEPRAAAAERRDTRMVVAQRER
jgi:hypothetical protein